MSQKYNLTKDTLAANGIAEDADFLQWPVSMFHADGFTLGIIPDEEGNFDTSKNHWAAVIETPYGGVRVSMESRKNETTGEHGLLVLKRLSYIGKSNSVIYRETYTWQNSDHKVKDVLQFILTRNLHRFKMFTTADGAKKECRHHL